jgi:hypothetical protein
MRNAPVESSGECIFHPAVAADEWSGERKRVRLIPQLLTRPLGIKNSFSAPQKENAPGQKQYLESFARHFSFSLSLWVYAEKKRAVIISCAPGGIFLFMSCGCLRALRRFRSAAVDVGRCFLKRSSPQHAFLAGGRGRKQPLLRVHGPFDGPDNY